MHYMPAVEKKDRLLIKRTNHIIGAYSRTCMHISWTDLKKSWAEVYFLDTKEAKL